MRPAAAEFCEKFEATYPDVTEIVKSLDESTSTDADAELIEELEEQVLYYNVLYHIILYYNMLCYIKLYCIVLNSIVLYYIVLYFIVLYFVANNGNSISDFI